MMQGNLSEMGRLLTQGSFNLWYGHKSDRLKDLRLKPMQRHLFLYEKAVLFCKKNGKNDDHATYCFKRCLKVIICLICQTQMMCSMSRC